MTPGPRLGIFVVPSPRLESWKSIIAEKAVASGWALDGIDVQTSAVEKVGGTVLMTQDLGALEAFSATDCVVLFDEPDACLATVAAASRNGIRANEVRSAVSAPWAAAHGLALRGAVIADARSSSIVLPWLGTVSGPCLAVADDAGAERGGLAMYDRLPVPIGGTAIWTPAQFDYPFKREFFGGGPNIDLTGRPRGLVYGPFVHLPQGGWRVDIDISVDPEQGKVPLRFDWGSGEDFVTVLANVTVPGQYALTLVNRWERTIAVQMRIWLTEGIFRGKLSFHGCRVTRVADDTAATAHQGA